MSKNAVIYARYSSDRQLDESIEGQIRECTAFAEREKSNHNKDIYRPSYVSPD